MLRQLPRALRPNGWMCAGASDGPGMGTPGLFHCELVPVNRYLQESGCLFDYDWGLLTFFSINRWSLSSEWIGESCQGLDLEGLAPAKKISGAAARVECLVRPLA